MTFALLVPCYNAVRYLPRLRTQVDRLNPAFDEVILADDASTDETASAAEALGFRIIRLPRNLGPGGARNALARATSAEWIHFHDVDDEIAPDYLPRVRTAAGGGHDGVFHAVDFIDENARTLLIRWQCEAAAFAADPAATLLRGPMPTMSSLLRRSAFLATGGFNEQLRCFEDGDLHFRLATGGARLAWIPEVLEWSLRHDGGAGSDQLYCFQCRLRFLETYFATGPARLQAAVAEEAEITAAKLALLDDKTSARRAIALCRKMGRNPPTSRNPVMRLLKTVAPAYTLLRWQARQRNRTP